MIKNRTDLIMLKVFIVANGPAIWGGCVTRRQHRAGSRYFSQKVNTVQGGYGACFCRPGTNFIEHYACRGTSLIEAGILSRYRIFVGGTGAVSRYNFDRSREFIPGYKFGGRHWRSVAVQAVSES